MQAIIPGTLQGALILDSELERFLSELCFVIISGIGVVLAMFPLINRVGTAHVKAKPKVVAHGQVADAETEAHIAVIAAAVSATLGGAHRIVSIEPTHRRGEGLTEGRFAHHTSHSPHRKH